MGLNAIDIPEFLNMGMSVKELPMDTVLSLVVPYLAMKSLTLTPLSFRSTTSLPSPVRVPSGLVSSLSAT